VDEPQRDLWAPFDALERTVGPEKAALLSHRPPLIRVSRPTEADPGEDLDSTAHFLARAALEKPGGPLGDRAGEGGGSGVGSGVGSGSGGGGGAPVVIEEIKIVEPIGQGGMGVIFKAVQSSFGREIALKRAASDDPALLAQFVSEARITGSLEHANIVPVYTLRAAVGGPPELAMKLIRGASWADLLHTSAGQGLDLEAHLRIFLSVCNAVSYAHRQRIIHRDLKPENVMTDVFGQVFVVDWGIAVGLDAAACAARDMLYVGDARQPAGTPSYMPPELALGDWERQGVRTDVYLLGCCLHEVITRRRRHEAKTLRDILALAVSSAPLTYDASVPWELAEICNKATAARPEDRYPDVESLRVAVEGYLKHREAHALAAKGLAQVEALGAAVDRALAAPAAPAAPAEGEPAADVDREIHVLFAEAQFALEHALSIWDGVREAREGLREASLRVLDYALATGDVKLAARLADDAASRARVAALEADLAARARELEALRSEARRLDWSATGSPLGTTYIVGGVLGSAAMFFTRYMLTHDIPYGLIINASVWVLCSLSIGAVAFTLLRRAHVPDSLVSPRLIGMWGAVALGGMAVGALNELRATPLAHDMVFCALIVGIGFASMAFQTRLWLLVPSGLFFAGALVCALFPDRGFEVMGVLWFLGMVGVGVALKLGATLEERRPGVGVAPERQGGAPARQGGGPERQGGGAER
jgi:hypothetical protein